MNKLLAAIIIILLAAGVSRSETAFFADEEEDGTRRRLIEEVTTEEVKRFLDPTRMISRLAYDFQMSFLPGESELMTHKIKSWYAVNKSNAIWVDVPYLTYSLPELSGWSGLGDISVGWGFIVHENVRRRLTTVAAGVEFRLPTGDPAKGTGLDSYIVKPAVAIATNPTDLFPVYITGRYAHSFGDGGLQVRSVELTIHTFHILPKGFFLALIPSFIRDWEHDFNVFSLGLGAGWVLNRRLSLQGGFVERVSGKETFDRGFSVGITYLWGKNKESQ